MARAIKEAINGMNKNEGGPFGAVIVRNGKMIAQAHNMVIKTNDPTAHAEIMAIRRASKKLGHFHLPDCEIYTTCEPCPMCLAAIHWARIPRIYYACTRNDAEAAGFDDNLFHKTITGETSKNRVSLVQVERTSCLKLFEIWEQKKDKIFY
ncbi:MAG: nucleoside deaminase [Candidatus Aminicenantes bacterium]|nr:nucleoside deaminase [Candidatus Aminicenantes bacterium]